MEMSYGGLRKVISGGQTGADQGGLLAAYQVGVKTGGTAPENYMTDAGPNHMLIGFGLSSSGDYSRRTKQNIDDSDGTVLICYQFNSGGSRMTREYAGRKQHPLLCIDVGGLVDGPPRSVEHDDKLLLILGEKANALSKWIVRNSIGILNVAGNRERQNRPMQLYTQIIVAKALNNLSSDGHLYDENF